MALLHQDGATLQGTRQGQTHLREVHPGEGTIDTDLIDLGVIASTVPTCTCM